MSMYSTANSSAGTKGQYSDDACPCTVHFLWQVQRVMFSTNSSAGTKGQYSDDACPCTVHFLLSRFKDCSFICAGVNFVGRYK